MWKKIVIYILLLGIVAGTVFWIGSGLYSAREDVAWEKAPAPIVVPVPREEEPEVTVPDPLVAQEGEIRTVLNANVPFVAQAPYGNWSNPIYQDACEETSITMVAYALSGKPLTQATADKEILALADYGEEKFGHFVDTSAADTATMLKEYYDITADVRYGMTVVDMKRILSGGSLIIVPADGRKLGNPNFTPPGPVNHMLVITGYDAETKEFVTNDPGTRAGKNYRYDEKILFAAIRDYPTGNHLPNADPRKAMIVVPIGE